MSLHPMVVKTARNGWRWEWNQLMNGLAPADKEGNYKRPFSFCEKPVLPLNEELNSRSNSQKPRLIIGRSCPWAHRTWLIHALRGLESSLSILIAKPNHQAGRWEINPSWLGSKSLLSIYKACGKPPTHRATVPVLIDPGRETDQRPQLISNESIEIVELLKDWPSINGFPDLAPKKYLQEISDWGKLLQPNVNDGVYRCGFARTQFAYDRASLSLFEALSVIEKSLNMKGPWLCGENITVADIKLFPTLIRWEMIYMPLFKCSKKQLWEFPKIWEWRKRFYNIPTVKETCHSQQWREDYFGALFPLNPSNIIPNGPDLERIVNSNSPITI